MICLLIASLASCRQADPVFDAPRAFRDLIAQTEFGPRVPGTDAHRRCADWLRLQMSGLADSLWDQPFVVMIPETTDSPTMNNIIARFGRHDPRRILLAAHWDTRPLADMDPDPANRLRSLAGANDGASGVAVLLEIARALKERPPGIGVDIVFFDAEDGGEYGSEKGWCLGSYHFAAHLPAHYEWAVVVDMVGDSDLALYKEAHSLRYAPEVVERIWKAAADAAEKAFRPERETEIFDDHMPLLMQGVPAADIIDIRYPYWHTSQDTPDKCSAASLAAVGRVLLRVIYSE